VTPYANMATEEPSQVGAARREATAIAKHMGFDDERCGRVALVVTELGTNLVRHASRGRLLLGQRRTSGAACFEVLALDSGPGMADVDRCLQDGYTTGSSPGTGLGAVKRLSDQFAFFSAVGAGTIMVARIGGHPPDEPSRECPFEVSGICLAAPGEIECGDGWEVRVATNKLAVMVADGLGHGLMAAQASKAATDVFAAGEGVPSVVLERTHQALGATRGAAIAMAELDSREATVTFAGAGNVIGRLVSGVEDRSLLSQHGTVGLQIRRIKDVTYPWPDHAIFVMHSDGITSRWSLASVGGLLQCDPSVIAGWIIRDHCRGRDDVTVVVVKRRLK
jgi:anti-sigma regulatory factor (Ser/Thr protein kinase)